MIKVFLKSIEKFFFVIGMKTIYNFIRKTHKTIDVVDVFSYAGMQHFGRQRKGSAVGNCNCSTAISRYLVK